MSTMSPQPEQRRILKPAADRDVHPVAPPPAEVEDLHVHGGHTTADAVVTPKKDKLVTLSVEVPKSLRKALRDEAERRGMTVDQLVGILLGDRVER